MTSTNNPLGIEQAPDGCGTGIVPDGPQFANPTPGGCPVVSVNDKIGAVTLDTDDIPEGSNKYYTDARVRMAISADDPVSFDQTTGKISHKDSAVTAGTYGSVDKYPQITVDARGHITSITEQNLPIGNGTVGANLQAIDVLTGLGYLTRTATNTWALRSLAGTSGRIKVTNPSGTADVSKLDLEQIGTAGAYGSSTQVPKITVDAFGRITGIELVSISTTGTSSSTPSLGELANVQDEADVAETGMILVFDGTQWIPQVPHETPVTTKNTPTVTLQATGLDNHTLQADVNILEVLNRIRNTPAFKSLFCEIANSCIVPVYSWIADSTICERSSKFNISKSIINLYSPMVVQYDSVLARAFVTDADNVDGKGNIAWFNPLTATSATDFIYSDKVKQANVYCHVTDAEKRKIYLAGKDTGGLIVYDIPTDSIITVPYGTDGIVFNRVNVVRIGNNIYCSDSTTDRLVIINRTTLVVSSIVNLGSVPSPDRFMNGGFQITGNDSEIYVCAGSGSSVSTIGVYSADFTTLIAEIVLPGTAQWTGSKYWQSAFYDAESQHVYVGDNGSSQMFIIDTVTHTIVSQQIVLNRQGKTNATFSWSVNPVTNELMRVVFVWDNATDPTAKKSLYLENRATYNAVQVFKDIAFGQLTRVDNTSLVIGADPGLTGWAGGGATKDGKLIFIDSASAGGNTTRLLTLTLKEMLNGSATGATKPNNIGDPDYIAPVTDATACPVTIDLSCVTDVITTTAIPNMYFEFNLPRSVLANGAVTQIRVSAFDSVTTSIVGTTVTVTKPGYSYLSGSISSIPGGSAVSLQVEYLAADATVLKTCTP